MKMIKKKIMIKRTNNYKLVFDCNKYCIWEPLSADNCQTDCIYIYKK